MSGQLFSDTYSVLVNPSRLRPMASTWQATRSAWLAIAYATAAVSGVWHFVLGSTWHFGMGARAVYLDLASS